jgi:hypothetical protein
MNLLISEEKKNEVRTRINSLYEMCGNINPIIYYIESLTNQFNSIIDTNDCKAFEVTLAEAERNMLVYYNRNGVSRAVAESQAFNHLMVYKVRNSNESEGRYFFHIELANLFIRAAAKTRKDCKYHLKKVFNGFSVCVTSPLFFS